MNFNVSISVRSVVFIHGLIFSVIYNPPATAIRAENIVDNRAAKALVMALRAFDDIERKICRGENNFPRFNRFRHLLSSSSHNAGSSDTK